MNNKLDIVESLALFGMVLSAALSWFVLGIICTVVAFTGLGIEMARRYKIL